MSMTALIHPFPSQRLGPRQARIWLLLSNRVGDNNQLFALAQALGYRFEAKDLRFNRLRKLTPLHGSGLAIVSPASRGIIESPWPDLVISAGYPAVPVARHIRQASGGRTKIVHVGNARANIDDFDLHLNTPQYPAARRANRIELPFPIGNPAKGAQPTEDELDWLNAHPRPRRLIAVGGPARHWELDHSSLAKVIEVLRNKEPSGSIIVATSARTRASTRRFLERLTASDHDAVVETFPRFAVLLSQADEIHVTADSVSMISEAVFTGRPVSIIPIRRSVRGQIARWLFEPFGLVTLPNFPNFWELLQRRGLVGTVELPVASQVCDTVERAALAVRSLLGPGDIVDEEKPERSVPDLGSARCAARR
jgi:mitochondrial fission protein ELM1